MMKRKIKKINLLILSGLIPMVTFNVVSCGANKQENQQEKESVAPVGVDQKTWEKWLPWIKSINPNQIDCNNNQFIATENLIKSNFLKSLKNPEVADVFDWKKDDAIRWNFQKLLGLGTGTITTKPNLDKIDLSNLKDLMTLWFNYNNLSWFQNWQSVSGANRNRQSKGYRKNFTQIDNLKLIDLVLPENFVIQPFINEGKISFDLTISNSCGFTLADGFNSDGSRVILTDAYFNSWIKFKVEATIRFDNFDDQGNMMLDFVGINLDGNLKYFDGNLDFVVKDNNYLIKESNLIDSADKFIKFLKKEANNYLTNFKNTINELGSVNLKTTNLNKDLDYDFIQNIWTDGRKLSATSIDDNNVQRAFNEQIKGDFMREWKLDLVNNLFVQTPFGKWNYGKFEIGDGWKLYLPMIIPSFENEQLKFKVWDYL